MPLFMVVCQDAAGNRVERLVDAPSETAAVSRAVAALNSWRAVSALPSPRAAT